MTTSSQLDGVPQDGGGDVRDEVWLRCCAGHETFEPGLDTAWYNRTSGPLDRWHPTLEEGLKYLGH